jgi:hypothetical protein
MGLHGPAQACMGAPLKAACMSRARGPGAWRAARRVARPHARCGAPCAARRAPGLLRARRRQVIYRWSERGREPARRCARAGRGGWRAAAAARGRRGPVPAPGAGGTPPAPAPATPTTPFCTHKKELREHLIPGRRPAAAACPFCRAPCAPRQPCSCALCPPTRGGAARAPRRRAGPVAHPACTTPKHFCPAASPPLDPSSLRAGRRPPRPPASLCGETPPLS